METLECAGSEDSQNYNSSGQASASIGGNSSLHDVLGTYISPRNILTAFCPIACLHPATSSPDSSKFASDFDTAFAAFHRVVPHKSSLGTSFS